MKIAIINTIKPQPESGDGITEITYKLYSILKKKHSVDLIYPLNVSRRNDILGLLYANTFFKLKIGKLAHSDYDIIHIANHELGYVAKILRKSNTKAKIVSTIYDVVRVKTGFRNGFIHGIYNQIITGSIRDAVEFSDSIIFCASSVVGDVRQRFPQLGKNWKVVYLGQPNENFVKRPIQKKRRTGPFRIGYVGALSAVKNLIFTLKTAKLLLSEKSKYRFLIYGSGVKLMELKRYKEENRLDNVHFMGFAPEKKLLGIYDSFDVFLYPGLDESTSIPVINAQARGLPVLLYKKTKLSREMLLHSRMASDEEDAARMLEDLRANGYSRAERDAEVRYARKFTWEKASGEIERIYKSLFKE